MYNFDEDEEEPGGDDVSDDADDQPKVLKNLCLKYIYY